MKFEIKLNTTQPAYDMTRTIIRITLTAFSFLLLLGESSAQVIQEVQNSFNLYRQNALQEKLYVHTDKNVYLPGEVLWFKIYCVNGDNLAPLGMSKVAYVELLDNSQNPVVQAKIALKNGSGSGSLYIPVTVTNGEYRFRAYTNWMKNFSPEFYFQKAITLVNPLKWPDQVTKKPLPAYDVQFFPEGGNLVAGLESRVAFKAVGQNGRGIDVSGVVLNQHNDTVSRFKSFKFGMGSFMLTPKPGDDYHAVAEAADARKETKALPEVINEGYVMTLTDQGNGRVDIAVKSNVNTDDNIYLFAQTHGEIKLAQAIYMNNGSGHFVVNTGDLGYGITHFTIFNSARKPVCERLYFRKPPHRLLINAATDQQEYGRRKKVTVNIDAKDANGNTVDADMSMAVYRVDSLQSVDPMDVFSYLWLSSDLRGSIESPGYYFSNDNPETIKAIDNLMLTQGWSRFKWTDVLSDKRPAFSFLPEYSGHIITGKIVNTSNGKPAPGIVTYLGIPGRRVQLYCAESDQAGRLRYYTRDFYGPGEIIAKTDEMKDSTYRIDISSPFSDQYSAQPLPAFTFSKDMDNALQAHSLGVQVLNLYSGDKLRDYFVPRIDSEAFYGIPDEVYKLDDYTRYGTIEEDLREYVKEDNIVKSHDYFHIKVISENGFLRGDPLVLVDGIPVFNMNKVFALDPLKIKKLEVVPHEYYYGPSEDHGIFSFTSYKGDLAGLELDPHAIVMDYEGLELHRQFYSPVYDTGAKAASRIPDFRNLLYWSPSVHGGTNTVSFYSSDEPGKYVVVIQGITSNGNAGSQQFTFSVK